MLIMQRLSTCILAVMLALMTSVSFCPAAGANAMQVPNFKQIDYDRFQRENSSRSIRDLIRQASRCRQNDRIDSAAAFYATAAGRYSESLPERDIRRCAIASVNIGYIFLGWEMNPAAAYPWLMRADSIAKRHGFNDIRTSVKSNLGRMYLDYNNYQKAADYLRQTLAEVMAQRTDLYFGMSLMDFTASALFGQEHLLKGTFADQVIRYDVDGSMPLARYARSLQRAIARYKNEDSAGAARILMDSRQLIDVDSERGLAYVMHAIITGKFLMAAGNYKDASAILTAELASAKAEGYYNLLEKCYSMLIECARHTGDSEGAARYRYKALEIRDSLFSAARLDAVKDFEKTTALKELQAEEKAADIRAKRQISTAFVIIGGVLLLAGLATWLYMRRHKPDNTPGQTAEAHDTPDAAMPENPTVTVSDTSDASDESARQLLERISAFLEESDAVFGTDFSVETLADGIGSKPKAVSQAINQVAGMNFNTFIRTVRVKRACAILTDPQKMKTLTIESVAESVGYKSRTYFSKVFKDITGMTPSQFARQAIPDNGETSSKMPENGGNSSKYV